MSPVCLEWIEFCRLDGPEAWSVPSRRGLDADDVAGGKRELWLEDELELLGIDRVHQLSSERERVDAGGRPGVVDPNSFSVALGLIHRGVSVTEQFGSGSPVVGVCRRADADADI